MACGVSEATKVDGANLLDQDSGVGVDFGFGSKGRRSCSRTRRRNQYRGAGEKSVRLNDHAMALPILFVPDAFGEPNGNHDQDRSRYRTNGG